MSEVMIINRCPKCAHNTRAHVYDSNGKMRCPECPAEVCTVVSAREEAASISMLDFGELTTIGIKPINEMTNRELIEEIMHAQYVALCKFEAQRMRAMVAQIRVSSAKARIYREAGVDPNPYGGLFGGSAW